jgi:hypothetical protein
MEHPNSEQMTTEKPQPRNKPLNEASAVKMRASLKFDWGEVEVKGTLFLGRDPDFSPLGNRLEQGDFLWVSRRHAEIYVKEGRLFVRDVGSTHGTSVNDTQIDANEPAELRDGDRVAFSKQLTATVQLR